MHAHPLKVMTAAAACMWVTGIPALHWDTGCRAARVCEQHKTSDTLHYTSVTYSRSLFNPPAISLPLECQLIRLRKTLKALLKANALSLSLRLFTFSPFTVTPSHHLVPLLCCLSPSVLSLPFSCFSYFSTEFLPLLPLIVSTTAFLTQIFCECSQTGHLDNTNYSLAPSKVNRAAFQESIGGDVNRD